MFKFLLRGRVVTIITGMPADKIRMIPYVYLLIESVRVVCDMYIGLLKMCILEAKDVMKNIIPFIIVVFLVLVATVLFMLIPFVLRWSYKDDCENYKPFAINSKFVSKRVSTLAFLVGAQAKDYRLDVEKERDELNWLMKSYSRH